MTSDLRVWQFIQLLWLRHPDAVLLRARHVAWVHVQLDTEPNRRRNWRPVQPLCTIHWGLPCVQYGPNDVCFNETLLHCPQHSTAEAGSHEALHCVCDNGFYAEYEPDHTH